jgi:WAS family protein 1
MTNYRAFTVNTISHDLHREEAVCQIAASLAFLEQTSNEIFKRINDSIESARDKMRTFDSRINLIDLKINKIRGSNKAIQICSSANYPVANTAEDYVPGVAQKDTDDFYDAVKFTDYKARVDRMWKHLYHTDKSHDMKHKLNKYTTPYAPLDDVAFKEKLNEYSIENVYKYDSSNLSDFKNPDGLGSLLSDKIESVSSLLLFNTAQHVYKQSDLKDPLGDLDLKKKKSIYDQSDRVDLYEAPQSILKGS